MAKRRTVICASPHIGGTTQHICDRAQAAFHERYPYDPVRYLSVGDISVAGCIGCEACRNTYGCFRHDAMQHVLQVLQDTDELYIACPIYFAGPPSQFKAVLDRMQPLYWRWLDTPVSQRPAKRPARVLLIGTGEDPHGYDPAVVSMRSALAMARFDIVHIESAIGQDPELHLREWLGMHEN